MEQVAAEPAVRYARGLLSVEECEHIMGLALPYLARSEVVGEEANYTVLDEATGEQVGVRTSHSADIGRRYDRVLAEVEARVARFAGLPEVNSEPMQVQRYQDGQQYREHSDCFEYDAEAALFWNTNGGQRSVTVLLYLHEPEEGGETVFPNRQDWLKPEQAWAGGNETWSECGRKGVAVKPLQGSAVMFENLSDPNQPTPMANILANHAGCPVLAGEKWTATKWFHIDPYRKCCWDALQENPEGFEPRSALQHLATTSKRRRCHNGIPRAGERVVGPQQKAPQARAPAAGPAGQAGAGPQ